MSKSKKVRFWFSVAVFSAISLSLVIFFSVVLYARYRDARFLIAFHMMLMQESSPSDWKQSAWGRSDLAPHQKDLIRADRSGSGTFLHVAIEQGNFCACRYLVEVVGIPLDVKDKFGRDAVQAAEIAEEMSLGPNGPEKNRVAITTYLKEAVGRQIKRPMGSSLNPACSGPATDTPKN